MLGTVLGNTATDIRVNFCDANNNFTEKIILKDVNPGITSDTARAFATAYKAAGFTSDTYDSVYKRPGEALLDEAE